VLTLLVRVVMSVTMGMSVLVIRGMRLMAVLAVFVVMGMTVIVVVLLFASVLVFAFVRHFLSPGFLILSYYFSQR